MSTIGYMKKRSKPHKYKIIDTYARLYGTRRDGTRFKFTVDTQDLHGVLEHRWYSHNRGGRANFIITKIHGVWVYLHHFLIGKPTKGTVTDHIDRDPTNNRRNNLRHVQPSVNTCNRKITNKHGFPGLYKYNGKKKISWQVRIRIKDPTATTKNTGGKIPTRLLHIGMFYTKKQAIRARRESEKLYFGESFH